MTDTPAPPAGFDQPETFRVSTTFKDALVQLSILLVVLLLGAWLILTGLFRALSVPGGGWTALPVAIGVCAVLVVVRKQQLEKTWGATSLTMSPQGISVDDPMAATTLSWPDVVWVGEVKAPGPVDLRKTKAVQANPLTNRGPGGLGMNIGGAIGQAVPTTQTGIAGRGVQQPKPGLGPLQRQVVEQNIGINGVDPQTGQPYVAVLPQMYDPKWLEGRLGAWVQHYRGDLVPAGQ